MGVLLLFKEKLRQLLPPDSNEGLRKEGLRTVHRPNGELAFKEGGQKTVDVQQIKERFEALDVSVDWRRFEQLAKFPNDQEHYESPRGEFTTERSASRAR